MNASKELLRGTLRTIVLKLLHEYGSMYGYEITQKVKELSNNQIQVTFGALYPTLHKLEKDGILKTNSQIVDHRTRKYYCLTVSGRETANQKIADYFQFMTGLNGIMLSQPNLK